MKLNRRLANKLVVVGLSAVALSLIIDILTAITKLTLLRSVDNIISPVLLVGGISAAAVGNIIKWFVKK